ncbi:hypothetical protein [Corynebacterium vitaeruminis]|uniref:hypothetical protein n=1 Tax=Corynebacterium vitaeruminis TaxID=38305 RepID=UPI0023F06B90|nr:hypothetical protein [Corynebacterium vitaeruminis]
MTTNAKAVAEALRIYVACIDDGVKALDYYIDDYILANDLEVLADALESEHEIDLDILLKRLEIKRENGDYKWA